MRKVLAFAVVATATLGIGFAGTTVKAAEPAQNIDISKMKVNWSDEFNGTELNSDHWTPEIGNGNWGWGNNEKEYYKANNISVSDGTRLKPRQKKLVVTIGHLEESKVQERLTLDMDMLKQE